ncbi:hypothetical protein [Micromonospora ureilytica]|uniref:hypothetical protein n=1 Tax=Micromonospora ureilytica TaxID=709868 RepID=UPI0040395992
MGARSRTTIRRRKAVSRLDVIQDHVECAFSGIEIATMISVYTQIRRELIGLAAQLLPGGIEVGKAGAVLQHEAATGFMDSLLSAWGKRLTLPGWDAAKWLYVVRRIPARRLAIFVQGALSHPADVEEWQLDSLRQSVARLLPLSATAGPSRTAPIRRGAITYYSLSKEDALEVLEQIVATAHFVLLAGTARKAGKGGRVVIRSDWPPYCEHQEELESAISAYDRRIVPGLSLIAVAGAEFAIETDTSSASTIFACTQSRTPEIRAVPAEVDEDARGRGMELRYETGLLDIKPYLDTVADLPGDDRSWFSGDLPALLALLHCFSGDKHMTREAMEWQVRRLGYVRTARSLLSQSYADRSSDLRVMRGCLGVDPEPPLFGATLRELTRLPVSRFPVLPGPLIRSVKGGEEILVDVLAATDLLARRLLLASANGGVASNARGFRFEDDIQSLIDRTPWKPSAEYLSLRKILRRPDDSSLTDVDAVAVMGKDLLLVSAKSYPYSLEYSIGDFKAVRAVRIKLEADLVKWQRIISYLRTSRIGKNYTISPEVNIHGVVVTPFPAFVPNAGLSETLPGLRVLCSADELYRYLRKGKRVQRRS